MDIALFIGTWALPLIYLALVIDYGATFILRVRTRPHNPWVPLAVAVHVAVLVLRGARIGALPLVTNAEILSVIALSAAVVYWVTELAGRDRRTGVFVFLLIFLFQYTSSVFLSGTYLAGGAGEAPSQVGWGRLHVLPAIFAYTALAFAAVYATLYLLGQRDIKRRRIGLLFDRLPPLELLGRMSWYALLVGFVLMTGAMITGAVLFRRGGSPEQAGVETKVAAKIIIGSVAWVIYAVAVGGRLIGKWSMHRVSQIAAAGFLVVLLVLVMSMILS
jgi:ABC-type uncharacterized transport system permease subunit